MSDKVKQTKGFFEGVFVIACVGALYYGGNQAVLFVHHVRPLARALTAILGTGFFGFALVFTWALALAGLAVLSRFIAEKGLQWWHLLIVVVCSVALWTVTKGILNEVALGVYEAFPFGYAYADASERYSDECEVEVQDGENSSHVETDWHAGEQVCYLLAKRVSRLYPGPTWLFGVRPHPESD